MRIQSAVSTFSLLAALALEMSASATCQAAGDPNQGYDEPANVIHNGLWQRGMPLGALGCGRFEFLPSGWFSRFSINNNWDKPLWEEPWRPVRGTFFAVRTAGADPAKSTTRWLRFGWREQELPGVKQIAHVAYRGQFPFVDTTYEDPALPVRVALRAWSALVPHNAKDSSLPVAFFEFTLENPTAQPLETSLMFSMENLVGCGGYFTHEKRERWAETDGNCVEPAVVKDTPLAGARLFSTKKFEGMRLNSSGEYWLLSDGPVTMRGWKVEGDGAELTQDFTTRGELGGATASSPATAGAICRKVKLPAGGKQKLLFMFVWWMPHHVTMDGKDHGHYYLREFSDPASLAAYALAQRERLARETAEWGRLVNESNLPEWLKRLTLDCTFPMFSNSMLTREGQFSVHEDPSWMEGALGTMDQRTVSHVFAGTFFPELSRSELELFRQCQWIDGQITHFCGNIYQKIGDAKVWYGITGWPDLSAVYIWQVLKHYRWTGDRKFLDESWPGIKRALDWLVTADRDGDGVPEGGTTYDAGVQYAGCFVFTASAYAAGLRSAMEIASIQGDEATRIVCQQRLESVLTTMRQRLWTGKFFAKCFLPDRGIQIATLFTPQLAGDWMTRMIGLPRLVSAEEAQTSLDSLLRVNGRRSLWPPADEFTPDGNMNNGFCWFTYQWTYWAGMTAAEGFVDDALELTRRTYEAIYRYHNAPWGVYLNFDPVLKDTPSNASYMSAMAGWWWLYQLSGASVDVSGGTLFIAPRLPTKMAELHMPLFFPRMWLWLDYAPAKKLFQVKVLRHFGEPVTFQHVAGDAGGGRATLPQPFVAKTGASLDLNPWHGKLGIVTARPPMLEQRAFSYYREGLSTLSWTATVSDTNSQFHPNQAYDGILETRWQSQDPVTTTLWWQLDLGRQETFRSIEAQTSPPGLTVELSADGKQWQPMDPAKKQLQARFVRLRPLPAEPTKEPWRVFEVTVRH